ncbi:uncharacterized protein LOC125658711 [Ostrea edulis]|uniref:uncharacterized protein LOC125658711 n=1 Tax=Ostrea edulis TaxID=37623 RepID=UPI002096522D|nr:uncharacterized protein LOC125658711 [Ostrea edulis]
MFRCYNSRDSTVNFRALSRGLLRKTLKLQQQSFRTFQQYLSARTPYVTNWSLFTMKPCLRIIKPCPECISSHYTTDLEKDFETLKTILEVIGSVLAEDEAKQSSKIRHSLKSLRRFTKQLLCEIHTFLLMSGKHGIGDGFVNDIVQSRDWCVFKSLSARYERDVFVLRQIASISSEIYNRYKKIFL